MFLFKRPFAAVAAGLATALIGLALNAVFAAAWAAQHAAIAN